MTNPEFELFLSGLIKKYGNRRNALDSDEYRAFYATEGKAMRKKVLANRRAAKEAALQFMQSHGMTVTLK